jgi:hypothetical protein
LGYDGVELAIRDPSLLDWDRLEGWIKTYKLKVPAIGTGQVYVVECKVSTSPSLNRGFWNAMNDLKIKEAWIIAPVKDTYPLENGVRVAPLQKFIDFLESLKH